MLSKFKHTIKHTAIYSIGGIANKLIGLILLPLYTSYLTSYEYGMLAILEVTNQVLVSFIGFRLSTAMMRWYSSEEYETNKKSIVFTSVIGVILGIVFYNLTCHPFTEYFSQVFFDNSKYAVYFRYLIFWGSFEILNLYVSDLLRIKEKPVFYVVIMSVKLSLVLALNILFIVKFNLGILGIIYGNLLGSLFVTLATFPFLLKNINFRVRIDLLKEMLKYSIPLIFTNISNLILTLGDRYFIKYFLSYHEVGIYSIGFKLVNVVKLLFIQSFQIGFIPIAYKMFNDKDAKLFFSKLFTYFTLTIVFASLVISFFSKEFLLIITKDSTYIEAYLYIPLFAIAVMLRGIQLFFTLGFHYSKKTRSSAIILIIAVMLNIILNILLIPTFKLYGASISTIISSLVIVFFYSRSSQKYYYIPYDYKKISIIIFIFLGYLVVFYVIADLSLILSIIIKSVLLIILPFLLLAFRFFSKKEIELVKNKWKKLTNKNYIKDERGTK